MDMQDSFKPITKPISAWNKPLKANFKDLFKSLTKTVASGAMGNWEGAAVESVEALRALGLEKDVGGLAWLLIRRSLTHAIYELVAESSIKITYETVKIPGDLCDTIDLSLENSKLKIDKNFFNRPADLPVIEQIKKPFEQWMVGFGLSEADTKAIAARLPNYFVYALNNEWSRHRQLYAPMQESIDTPFTKAGEREQAWSLYYSRLCKQVTTKMFDENFSLSDVYVPLRAYYEEKKEKKGAEKDVESMHAKDVKRIVVDLEKEIDEWLKNSDKQNALRVISGGPGSGKSSFAKMYCAQLTESNRIKVLYIPLHLFDTTDDLVSSISQFVIREEQILNYNPLDEKVGDKHLLIVFDGLDELSKRGRVSADIALQFIGEINRTLSIFNSSELRLKVLICGREVSVQAHAGEFRKPHQILYIIPYCHKKYDFENVSDPKKLLQHDQRTTWWKKYGAITKRGYSSLPDELKREDIDEITAQPLLNYLLALSYTRGKLDFSKNVNLNLIYKDLLESVFKRGYEDHPHLSTKGLELSQFTRVLEEIGLAAWHGNGRTATLPEIEQHCTTTGLTNYFEMFQEGAKEGVTRLLTAFYFRQHGISPAGEKTFEFTHKSFGEYLTAKRIVGIIRKIFNALELRKIDIDSGIDIRGALVEWACACGPTPIDRDILKFIYNEVELEDASIVKKWQEMFCSLIEFMLQHGMPMESIPLIPNYKEQTRQARNAEEALIVALSSCSRITEKVSQIHWPDDSSFGSWISKLQGQRNSPQNVLALNCLNFMDLSGCTLYMRDLYGANLINTNIQNC